MDLSSVTAIGVIAFACFKFAGYILAFVYLKRIQPAIQSSASLMAAVRAVLGVVVGGALYLGWDALRHRFSGFYNLSLDLLPYYLVLVVLRILVWEGTIHMFARGANVSTGKEWMYAAGGGLWSCVLDIPAAFLTLLVPGAALFC